MILPRGVTGFGNVSDRSAQSTDFAAFKAACYAAAWHLGGSVLTVESCDGRVTPNFHEATLSIQAERVGIVCNARLPLVAAIRPRAAGDVLLAFADVPGLGDVVRETESLRLLSAAELEAPLSAEMLSNLAHAVLVQVKYWRPTRVGDVIFNFWD